MARKFFEEQAIRRRGGPLASGVAFVVYSDVAGTVLADISATSGGSSIAGSEITTADIAGLGPAALRFYGPPDGTDTLYLRCPTDSGLGVQEIEADEDERLDALEAGGGGGGAHPNLATHDALGLATDAELATHGADTTAVHGITDTAQLALRNAVNTFTLDQVFKSGRPILDVDGYISGTPGTTAAADTAGIELASLALDALGGGFLWFNNRTYLLTRRIGGEQYSGGILWRPGQSFVFAGSTLKMQGNSPLIKAQDPTTATVFTITADVPVGSFTVTGSPTTNFTVGDTVWIRAGDNAWDDVETYQAFYARVEAKTAGTLTLDRPFRDAVTVASTEAHNKVITKLGPMVEDVALLGHVDLIGDIAGGGNAECGMDLRWVRNVSMASVAGQDVGAGLVMGGYINSLHVQNLHVRECEAQGGQASKGRVLNFWNSDNVHIDTVYAERFEGVAVFIESYSKKIKINNLHLANTHPDRSQATLGLFQVAQSSELEVDNLLVDGIGGAVLTDEGGTTGNRVALGNVELHLSTQLKGGFPLANAIPGAQVRVGATRFSEVKSYTRTFRLTASMSDVNPGLPSGLYRRVRVYVSTKTGLTFFYLGSDDVLASLIANQTVEVNPSIFGSYGVDAPFNNTMAKALALYSDGTVPAGAWGAVQAEYYPDVVNDGGLGLLQAPYDYLPVTSKPTLAAAATDPATTQTLANSVRTALINLGLGQ